MEEKQGFRAGAISFPYGRSNTSVRKYHPLCSGINPVIRGMYIRRDATSSGIEGVGASKSWRRSTATINVSAGGSELRAAPRGVGWRFA